MGEFQYQELFEHAADTTNYSKFTSDFVFLSTFEGKTILKVQSATPTLLVREVMQQVAVQTW